MFAIWRRVGGGGGLSIAVGIRRAKTGLARKRVKNTATDPLEGVRLSSSLSPVCDVSYSSLQSSRFEVQCGQSVKE